MQVDQQNEHRSPVVLCDFVVVARSPAGTAHRCRRCLYTTKPLRTTGPIRRVCTAPNEPPSAVAMAASYISTVTRWELAGRPQRSDELVARITEHCCQPCPHFSGGSCGMCGCPVRTPAAEQADLLSRIVGPGLRNKIRMATEDCPDRCQACGHSRWQHGAGACQCGCPGFEAAGVKTRVDVKIRVGG